MIAARGGLANRVIPRAGDHQRRYQGDHKHRNDLIHLLPEADLAELPAAGILHLLQRCRQETLGGSLSAGAGLDSCKVLLFAVQGVVGEVACLHRDVCGRWRRVGCCAEAGQALMAERGLQRIQRRQDHIEPEVKLVAVECQRGSKILLEHVARAVHRQPARGELHLEIGTRAHNEYAVALETILGLDDPGLAPSPCRGRLDHLECSRDLVRYDPSGWHEVA
mmetsp:Transcript_107662/g.240176  ORF Transcript_107662/g.240176 Transcript_107662/m.240176 type:complete len:222 (+) Transcript_107662:203-868(+)